MKKKIALDVDGVLLRFMEAFDEAARIVLKREIKVNHDENGHSQYSLETRINATREEAKEILEYMQTSRMYAKLKPFDGVKEALEKIKEADYEIYIVTALPEKAREMRLENLLNELNLVPKEIFCVGMGLSKAEVLEKLRPDIFIDDRVDYLVSAPHVYHLALIDQKESQKDKESFVDVHVGSLLEWAENILPIVTKQLDKHYQEKEHLQYSIKLESIQRKLNCK